ncbi:MAG: polyribonucleotide nucleotidyltransferase [Candidatus Omnitrophica bacterium]|nr:polyribonucleotide nucleotidyltransferase [Candidatus Omnitrophota bacterium]
MTMQRINGTFGNHEIILETGRMAKQAHGAVLMQCGDTVVLAAAVSARDPKPDQDFFPLTVDYRERTYAAGKIPGGFFKREGRPSEHEILVSRLIDRPIRPLFPEDFLNETQVTITVLSVGQENMTDILSMNAAFASVLISNIPFSHALGAARVGLVEGQFVVNPSAEEMEKSELDLVIAATEEKVMMLEAGAREISEEKMFEAIKFGHEAIKKIISLQKELAKKVGQKKREVTKLPIPASMFEIVRNTVGSEFNKIFELGSKEEREEASHQLYDKVKAQFNPEDPQFNAKYLKRVFDKIEQEKVREYILDSGKRPDGRGARDIRSISCEVGFLPRTHGSALFTRGQTQSLSVATLGTADDEQRIDALDGELSKRFMLHYNFPSFSVGEAKQNRGPGRREIGHGALAERALVSVIPSHDDFPYTIRLVSDIMESNGSSSMATVCAGTLALMDAGVPISAPVAGIALGLVTRGSKYQVLTDIAGIEDHHGDQDFKAAGTAKGLTALQMDIKIDGVTDQMIKDSMDAAKEARFKILEKITQALAEPRKELSAYAPRITTLKINPEKIGLVIGPGGKNIKKLVEETGAKINIDDDGTVSISSIDAAATEEAIRRIKGMTDEAEMGKVYEGSVKKLVSFGAFIEYMPGREGLCHVSEVAEGFVKSVNDYLRLGDIVPVKVVNMGDDGKVSLSIKSAREGGMPMLPPDAERDPVSEISRGRNDRSRSGGRR